MIKAQIKNIKLAKKELIPGKAMTIMPAILRWLITAFCLILLIPNTGKSADDTYSPVISQHEIDKLIIQGNEYQNSHIDPCCQ